MYALRNYLDKKHLNQTDTTNKANKALAQSFARRFVMLHASTPELIAKVQRLRYQVYCIENSFEDPARFPDGREHDEFDNHALQGLLYDNTSKAIAGAVRLILPHPGKPGNRLPIQGLCRHPRVHDHRLLVGGAVEISRFAISKEYRRHARYHLGTGEAGLSVRSAVAEEMFLSNMALGLVKGLVQMSIEHGITDWFAVMEPALLRLLGRSAIYFAPLGPLVEYHRKRQPCYVNLNAMLRQVRQERPDVWDVITDAGR